MSEVRVRYAPSPTGFLHIGGVRTALFNWLYARRHGGKFFLRIEDTDLERSETRFFDDIIACLKWLGLNWDNEPLMFQAQRMDHYRAIANRWIEEGKAYVCTCTEEDVGRMREAALAAGKRPMYDRTCRTKKIKPAGGQSHVVRAALPTEGDVAFDDLIHGEIRVANTEQDDFVLIRSNGAPTYNFACVVDDAEMQITHVLRGDDHINNTPKQIHLYRFLGAKVPAFGHLSMILGPDKKKLSKRNGDVATNYYRGEGYLPESVLNFLVRLGWSHGDQEVFTVADMVSKFDLEHVQKTGAVFNAEKFLWLNGEHLKAANPSRLVKVLVHDFPEFFSPAALARIQSPLGRQVVTLVQPKAKLLKDLADQLSPLCAEGAVEVDTSVLTWNKKPDLKPVLKKAVADLAARLQKAVGSGVAHRGEPDSVWGSAPSLADAQPGSDAKVLHDQVDALFKEVLAAHGLKLGELMQPVRLAITGRLGGVGLFDLIPLLPIDLLAARLGRVQNW